MRHALAAADIAAIDLTAKQTAANRTEHRAQRPVTALIDLATHQRTDTGTDQQADRAIVPAAAPATVIAAPVSAALLPPAMVIALAAVIVVTPAPPATVVPAITIIFGHSRDGGKAVVEHCNRRCRGHRRCRQAGGMGRSGKDCQRTGGGDQGEVFHGLIPIGGSPMEPDPFRSDYSNAG